MKHPLRRHDSAGVNHVANVRSMLVMSPALGAEPAPTTPEGFDAHIRVEVAKYRKIVQDAGIKPE